MFTTNKIQSIEDDQITFHRQLVISSNLEKTENIPSYRRGSLPQKSQKKGGRAVYCVTKWFNYVSRQTSNKLGKRASYQVAFAAKRSEKSWTSHLMCHKNCPLDIPSNSEKNGKNVSTTREAFAAKKSETPWTNHLICNKNCPLDIPSNSEKTGKTC